MAERVCLGADCFAFGELLGKAPQVTKGACSRLGPTSSGSLTPTTLRGPAPNGHPCPSGALAASMPLGPLRVVYVRPAPKSRFAVFEPSRTKIKIKGFPAEAGPTRARRVSLWFDRSLAPRGNVSRDAPRHFSKLDARRLQDAERPGRRYHAERGNDQNSEIAFTQWDWL